VLLRPRLRQLEGELQHPGRRPKRDITVSCITISRSLSGYMRPPMLEYSPSVFSAHDHHVDVARLQAASGERTPGISRAGAG
jgi:hypothetical protein